ncbi:MAG: 50S ribosomal protein L18 [Candidatus Pacebacteria bacterium]|nr:50S ribosomal protein L18 [Candidatus Paceibacterota bacterium]
MNKKRYYRHKRIRAKLFGTSERPRFSVFRSLNHIYVQLIDDAKGKTILSLSDRELKKSSSKKDKRSAKIGIAFELGKTIAQKALDKKIEKVIFDRGGCRYHGRVKALAEGAREGGLKF